MVLLVSDLKRDYIQTHFAELEKVAAGEVQRRFEAMKQVAQEEFEAQGISPEQIRHGRAIDLRYSIQKYELPVTVAGTVLTETDKIGWGPLCASGHRQNYWS